MASMQALPAAKAPCPGASRTTSTADANSAAMISALRYGVAESPVMRSLIDAVIARDPARFAPGDSNLDWRLHAVCESEFALPWTEYHVDTSAGFVAAAMRQAAVAVDARGAW